MNRTVLAALGRVSFSSLSVALCLAAPTAAFAQDARYNLDIPAQHLESALKAFASATKVELVYDGRKVARNVTQISSRPLKGSFTAKGALERMLEGTGFTVRTGTSGVLVIEGGPGSARVGNDDADDRQVDVGERGISDILVIGSRTQNSDIRRTEDDAQPYKVFTKEDIQKSQANTLEDFFRTRLTTNTVQETDAQRTGDNISSGVGSTRSTINLRGIGANQTLILVDGRRLGDLSIQNVNSDSINQSGQPDINGIPLASIERIEVLSSTAGGIYGGNAVGGVVNIILRHDYRGLEVTANYQDTGDFKYPNGRIDVSGGFALEGGRTNITFGGSYSRSGILRAGDRPFSQRGFNLGFANSPEEFVPNADNNFFLVPPQGRGVNIVGAAPLTLKPEYGGGTLGSSFTTLPTGFTGNPSAVGAALLANAGLVDLEQPTGTYGARRSLLSSPEVRSFNVNVRRKFNDWLDVYADYNKFYNLGRGTGSIVGLGDRVIFLDPGASTNPFNQTIGVVVDNPAIATPYRSVTDTNRATVGFKVRLPKKWALGFDYSWNWSRQSEQFTRLPLDSAGVCALNGIFPGSPDCIPKYRAPGDTRPPINLIANTDFSPYLLTKPTQFNEYSTTRNTAVFRLSGALFSLPGGGVNFSGFVERSFSKEKLARQRTDNYLVATEPPASQDYVVIAPREQRSDAAYGEIFIPLFSERNKTTLLHALELQISARYDGFRTTAVPNSFGFSNISFDDAVSSLSGSQTDDNHSTNYSLSLRYSPAKDIFFRASYGTGFTQPTVNQVVTFDEPTNFGFRDPLRGFNVQDEDYILRRGAQSDLKPESSKSYSFGIVATPGFVPGLRISADYTKTEKKNEITSPQFFDLFFTPELYPGRFVRAPLTPQDSALGYTGGILTLYNISLINLLKSSIQNLDLQATYDLSTQKAGHFNFYGNVTRSLGVRRQTAAGTPEVNFTGFADGPLKWRANGGIDWTIGGFGVNYNVQFYGPYRVYSAQNFGPVDIEPRVKLQGSDTIPSQIYHDLAVSYTFANTSGALNGVRIFAGVQNLFDKSPPTLASTRYSQGGYSGYGDPRLRRFSLTLKKSFSR